MLDVYLLGVLVSLLKLGKLATLTLGTSFWAFVGLIVCLTLVRVVHPQPGPVGTAGQSPMKTEFESRLGGGARTGSLPLVRTGGT